jgi:hypothetical protein
MISNLKPQKNLNDKNKPLKTQTLKNDYKINLKMKTLNLQS